MKYATPIRSIRLKCLDCCCSSAYEVRLCQSKDCSLYPYRFGVRPTTAQKRIKKAETRTKHTNGEKINNSVERCANE